MNIEELVKKHPDVLRDYGFENAEDLLELLSVDTPEDMKAAQEAASKQLEIFHESKPVFMMLAGGDVWIVKDSSDDVFRYVVDDAVTEYKGMKVENTSKRKVNLEEVEFDLFVSALDGIGRLSDEAEFINVMNIGA